MSKLLSFEWFGNAAISNYRRLICLSTIYHDKNTNLKQDSPLWKCSFKFNIAADKWATSWRTRTFGTHAWKQIDNSWIVQLRHRLDFLVYNLAGWKLQTSDLEPRRPPPLPPPYFPAFWLICGYKQWIGRGDLIDTRGQVSRDLHEWRQARIPRLTWTPQSA